VGQAALAVFGRVVAIIVIVGVVTVVTVAVAMGSALLARALATSGARALEAVVLGSGLGAAVGVGGEQIVEPDVEIGDQLEAEHPQQARGQRQPAAAVHSRCAVGGSHDRCYALYTCSDRGQMRRIVALG
jgi:hypothetical protein